MGLWERDRPLAVTLAVWSELTVLLTRDDRFLLHEGVAPELVGVTEVATYAFYAGLMLFSLGDMALSVALDVAGWDSTVRRVTEENGQDGRRHSPLAFGTRWWYGTCINQAEAPPRSVLVSGRRSPSVGTSESTTPVAAPAVAGHAYRRVLMRHSAGLHR